MWKISGGGGAAYVPRPARNLLRRDAPWGSPARGTGRWSGRADQISERRKRKSEADEIACFAMVGEGGFEPPKPKATDLQSAPFDRSGIPPYSLGAGGRIRTPDLLITNQLLYQLSYTSASNSKDYISR